MAASLLGFGLLLAAGQAPAQELHTPYAPFAASPGVQPSARPATDPAPVLPAAADVKAPAPLLWQPAGPAGAPNNTTTMAKQQGVGTAIAPVALQAPDPNIARPTDEQGEYSIQLEPPGPERLFRLESERSLQERMRNEARQRPIMERITFPEEPVLSREAYSPRVFPPAHEVVEPQYVCYDRLYFEEKNSERYGWDLGFIQPFVSAGAFYWDLVMLPYHVGTEPCRKYECSAGYCLPGDPVPYQLDPFELSLTGAAAEAGTVTALFFIFPG
jgi:hypothetical protein